MYADQMDLFPDWSKAASSANTAVHADFRMAWSPVYSLEGNLTDSVLTRTSLRNSRKTMMENGNSAPWMGGPQLNVYTYNDCFYGGTDSEGVLD